MRQTSDQLGIRRVAADHDAERQVPYVKHGSGSPGFVDGSPDGRVHLPIHAGQPAAGNNRRRIEQPTAGSCFGETDNRCNRVAGQRREHCLKLAIRDAHRQVAGPAAMVGQASEHGFRTAQNVDASRLATSDLRRDETEGVHRAAPQKRCLIRCDLHPARCDANG